MNRSAWWKYVWVWLVPAALVLANGLWLLALRSAVLGRGAEAVAQLKQKEAHVKELERMVRELSETQKRLSQLQEELTRLREQEMGPMRQRLVPFLQEVVLRAQKVGLFPERISYAARKDSKSGLVHFTATYELTGSYEQLRRYMAELEAIPQFVVIERLGLRGEGSAQSTDISLQMVVGTYFSDWDQALLTQLGAQEASSATE
ncbi:MAG: type 4a pilus biogenesis protein PilO [Acidobacteriota bacterium]